MLIDAISYANGNPADPYFGRIELGLSANDRFVASYQHRTKRTQWEGALVTGTFARARDALTRAGFPSVVPFTHLIPGESPLELGWQRDGVWERGETVDDSAFFHMNAIASTILCVLDSNLARMPPGENTPVIEHHRIEP